MANTVHNIGTLSTEDQIILEINVVLLFSELQYSVAAFRWSRLVRAPSL